MSAIAGCISNDGSIDSHRQCGRMLRAMARSGPHGSNVWGLGPAAFGRNLFKVLPEDDFDAQPIEASGGRFLLAADVRIDNRAEIAAALGVGTGAAASLSDADLLAQAWERWEFATLGLLLGDYAVALWDAASATLTLARSPLAMKPLFYHSAARFLAFASTPAGLHAVDGVPRAIDMVYAAAKVAEVPDVRSSTIFKGIVQVRPGEAVRLREGREERLQLWRLERNPSRLAGANQSEALAAELDRAVTAQLRRYSGNVGAHLSAGRDSSAVAASAALALARQGDALFAFTGAPRVGFAAPAMPEKLPDESLLAAQTAALHPNIRHVICRHDAQSTLPTLSRLNGLNHGPLFNLAGLPWWTKVNEEAAARDVSVLLLGWMGNASISAGGAAYMRDLLVERGFAAWLRNAIGIGGLSWRKWRHLANVAIGPSMPPWIHALLMKAAGKAWQTSTEVPLLREPYRSQSEQLLRQQAATFRPRGSYFDYWRDQLRMIDVADTISLPGWGVDVRDPTADRRLVELCFSLSIEQLVSPSAQRPAYEAAFSDRLPREVLTNRRRGYQAADWFVEYPRDLVAQEFRRVGRNPIIQDLLDFEHIDRLLDSWPTGGWQRGDVISTYRNRLLGALALASYIDHHFQD